MTFSTDGEAASVLHRSAHHTRYAHHKRVVAIVLIEHELQNLVTRRCGGITCYNPSVGSHYKLDGMGTSRVAKHPVTSSAYHPGLLTATTQNACKHSRVHRPQQLCNNYSQLPDM